MFAVFERFEIALTKAEARSAAHPGACDDDVEALLTNPRIANQLKRIDPDLIRAELKGYGAWDATELADDEANKRRILWIAAGNIRESID